MILSFAIVVVATFLVLLFDFYSWFPTASEALNVSRCISKLAIDIYLFPAFYSTFNFFVDLKREHDMRDFDQGTIFIIAMVKVIWALNIINALISSIVLCAYHANYIVGNQPSDQT